MVCRVSIEEKVPYFNAGVYSSTKTRYGQVDEVFGPVNEVVSGALARRERISTLGVADVHGQVR
jgi:rRNA processing protein Gar1